MTPTRTQQAWRSLATICRKEFQRITRIWLQTLLPPAITMVLYFLIFGKLIGPRIGGMAGVTYIEYIIPGLIMLAVITNSYMNVVSSFFGAKFQRSHEELLVSPTPSYIIVIGYCTGGMLRGLSVALIVTGVSLFFTNIHIHSVVVTIVFIVMTSLLFSLAGLINAIFARTFDDVSIIPTFVLTPLTYLGGVFYSIDLLPEFFRNLSYANPILYLVNGFRYGFLGITDVDLNFAFAILFVFSILFFCTATLLVERGVGIRT